MKNRRVVVTGLGVVSPLGLNVDTTWQGILAGKSGIATVETFDVSDYPVTFAGMVKNFDPLQYFSAKDARKSDLFIQYGIAAAVEAMADSGLSVTEQNAHRIGVSIGSGIGGLPLIESTHTQFLESGPRKVSPFFIPGTIINLLAGQVSIRFGLQGPNIAFATACTTGAHSIGYAARNIAYGDADVMITGGGEMAVSPLGLSGFAALRALSRRNDDPQAASRPWDKDRDGFVLGDGAAILVLEEYEHAKKRGARIYAELAGFGQSGDAFHMTMPEPNGRGGSTAMAAALQDANLSNDSVQYINAHATSTPAGDDIEVLAIKHTFGSHANNVAVSSTKSMTGHLLGAAGAIEAVFSVLAIRDQVGPPTMNCDNPSEGCDLDFVPNEARQMKIDVALSNSFGFGGTNAALVFKRMT